MRSQIDGKYARRRQTRRNQGSRGFCIFHSLLKTQIINVGDTVCSKTQYTLLRKGKAPKRQLVIPLRGKLNTKLKGGTDLGTLPDLL